MAEIVTCHSEIAYAERPTSFEWQGNRFPVDTVLQRWRTPQGMHFQVSAIDGQIFELYYDLSADGWEVVKL